MISDQLMIRLIEYIGSPPWEDPIIVIPKNSDWGYYQVILKYAGYLNQNGVCVCQLELDNMSDLHHALVSRKDVLNHPQSYLIHHPYNVLVLHKKCHKDINRNVSLEFLSSIYGIDNIRHWHNALPFTSKFRRI